MATVIPPGSAVVVPCSNDPCPACVSPATGGSPASCEDCCARYAVTLAGLACAFLNKAYTLDRFAFAGGLSNCAWHPIRAAGSYPALARDADGNWAFVIVDLDGSLCGAGAGARLVLTAAGTADVPCPPTDPAAYAVTANDFGGAPALAAVATAFCATGCACLTLFESTYDCRDRAAGWTDPVALADYVAFADEVGWHYAGVREGGAVVVYRRTVKGAAAAACDGSDGACPRQATPARPTEDPPGACPDCPGDYSGFCAVIRVVITASSGYGPVTVDCALSGDAWTGTGTNPISGDDVTVTIACAGGVYTATATGLTLPVAETRHWTAAMDPDDGGPPLDAAAWTATEVAANYELTSVACAPPPPPCPATVTANYVGPGACTPAIPLTYDAGTGYWYSASGLSYAFFDGAAWHMVLDGSDTGCCAGYDEFTAADDPENPGCPPSGPWSLVSTGCGEEGSPSVSLSW